MTAISFPFLSFLPNCTVSCRVWTTCPESLYESGTSETSVLHHCELPWKYYRRPAWWVYLSGSLPLLIYLVWFCMFFVILWQINSLSLSTTVKRVNQRSSHLSLATRRRTERSLHLRLIDSENSKPRESAANHQWPDSVASQRTRIKAETTAVL